VTQIVLAELSWIFIFQQKKTKDEELIHLAEEQREKEEKKKEPEEKDITAVRMQHNREKQARINEVRGPQSLELHLYFMCTQNFAVHKW